MMWLNVERVEANSDMCWVKAKGRPCSRKGAVTVWWNGLYPKVRACRQHAKKVQGRRP